MNINTIGVIGVGTMGSGIAQIAAEAGFTVIVRDLEERFVQHGLTVIKQNLSRAVEKGKKSRDEVDAILERLYGAVDLATIKDADVVIEAIAENMALKKQLYAELDQLCRPETIFASNTSGLSITELGSATERPGKVVGMHFFNPVPVMKLVEVTRGADTTAETAELIMELARKLGKEPISVNEAPLFVVNRILIPMINEAAFVLMEGVATAEDIDRGMMLGANHPIGPLALADLVGLDVIVAIMDTLCQETQDSKYRTCPLLRKMVRGGRLGRKTGRGFYTY